MLKQAGSCLGRVGPTSGRCPLGLQDVHGRSRRLRGRALGPCVCGRVVRTGAILRNGRTTTGWPISCTVCTHCARSHRIAVGLGPRNKGRCSSRSVGLLASWLNAHMHVCRSAYGHMDMFDEARPSLRHTHRKALLCYGGMCPPPVLAAAPWPCAALAFWQCRRRSFRGAAAPSALSCSNRARLRRHH